MFLLVTVKDVVEVEPAYFSPVCTSSADPTTPTTTATTTYQLTSDEILLHRITERYVGKVIPGQGLCVAAHAVLSLTPGVIRGPCGSSWTWATFQAVVFCPAAGEIIRAKISRQSPDGIYLSLEFFDEIFIPGSSLVQPGSSYDDEKKLWCYQFTEPAGVEDGSSNPAAPSSPTSSPQRRRNMPETPFASAVPSSTRTNNYITGDDALLLVMDVEIRDIVSSITSGSNMEAGTNGVGVEAAVEAPPMSIVGSFAGTGLGPCAWY